MTELHAINGGLVRTATVAAPSEILGLSIDLAAEAAVISSVVNDEQLLDEVRSWLQVKHFYSEAHLRMYEACCAVRDAGKPLDVVTMMTWLRDNDRLGQVGGAAYVTTVLNSAPALGSSRLKAYALAVRDKWARRQTLSTSNLIGTTAQLSATPIEKIIDEGRAKFDALSIELGQSEKDSSFAEVMVRTHGRLAKVVNTSGLGQNPTGFTRLDHLLGGLQQTLMVLAARPGMGKTSLGTKIAMNVALRPSAAGTLDNGVYIASMETFDEEACLRMWCAEARVGVAKARTGMLTKDDWAKLIVSAGEISKVPLWIDDDSSQTASSLWSKCRRVDGRLQRVGKKLKLVVVDYLQLMKGSRPGMTQGDVVSENCRQLLAMANDLQCAVLALAQLNRECEKRPNKRPVLSDLRDSGEIENAARVVMFLYRDEYYDRASGDRNIAEINVAKQNNGPIDTVRVRWDGECTRFDNLAEEYDDAPPRPTQPASKVYGKAKQSALAAPKEEIPPAIVDLMVSTIGAGITFPDLLRAMGDPDGTGDGPGMTRGDVEKWLKMLVAEGWVGVDGSGEVRRLWGKR